MIRFRKQRHQLSCGIAAVSMIADKPYNTVLQDFIDMKDEIYWIWDEPTKCWMLDYGTTTTDLYKLFQKYGIQTNKKCVPYKGKDKLPNRSVLVVNICEVIKGGRKVTNWHWVVAEKIGTAIRILDPYRGEMLFRDLERIHSYLRIHE